MNNKSQVKNGNGGEAVKDRSKAGEGREGGDDKTIIVGIGASAGGVEALESLFAAMPDDTGFAFVVIQHLSPDFESLMPQILGRRTSMKVQRIETGVVPQANHVYVLPNGKSAKIEDGVLVAYPREPAKQHNTIDTFFKSLAQGFGELSVGIVLSGTGADGAMGIREVHDCGGLVIVQNERTSKFAGMPRAAIATGVADVIVPTEEMPEVLLRYKEMEPAPDGSRRQSIFAETVGAESRIYQLLHKSFGINFDLYKKRMFGRRLSRRIELSKAGDVESYLKRVESDPAELHQLYQDLLIGVTEFFRDPDAFMEMQTRVMPALIESAISSREFRVWVSPCATGEEAYSIAILIDELKRQRGYEVDVKIFATDVNVDCIEQASTGVFSDARLSHVSEKRKATYFLKQNNGYQVIPRLRRQIVFATHDLLQDAPFTKLDLVCCRNLLIYFNTEAKKKALSLFNFSLKSSGVLFLGPSETVSDLDSAYSPINENWRIYRKASTVKFSEVDLAYGKSVRKPSVAIPSRREDLLEKEISAAYDELLTEFMPSSILIDGDNNLMHVFGDAFGYLQFKEGRPSNDLLELLPPGFHVAVESGLKRVKIENRTVVYPGLKAEESGEQSCKVTVRVVETKYTPKYLVTIEPEDPLLEIGDSDSATVPEKIARHKNKVLEEELRETRESLHDSILSLKSTNEEMQSTNEELIAANEELQSTNEELHSVNEELYTVNAEHQRKITALTEMTDDMDNLLDSLQVDTIFLDRSLAVRKFTLGIANTFKLLPQDVGRNFESFNHELKYDDLIGSIESVLETEKVRDEEVEDNNGNWYLMRLLPYSSRGKVDGVLLTLIDITRIKETEQLLIELSEIVQASDDAIFRVSATGEIRTWNRGAQELFLLSPELAIGKNIATLGLDERSESMLGDALMQIQHDSKIDHVEILVTRRNGDEIPVESTISPIYSPDGNLDGASVVLRDITAQKKAELQMRDEVKRRDHFLAVLSHELRNPAAAIANSLAVIQRGDVAAETHEQAIDIIQRQSVQLGRMLDDLLHVARVTHDKFSLQLEVIDITATAKQVVECIEHRIKAKNQRLVFDFPEEPLLASVDEARIIQAQTNLLINANKYTGENGVILYAIRQDGDRIVVEIKDDGEGMSEELIERIFEVFVQAEQDLDRSSGGMGLGLPLVKMIAAAHGGTIEASSLGIGFGSTFRLSLPVSREVIAALPGQGDQSNRPSVQLAGTKLLLIEDNAGAREMLSEYLQLERLNVETAENGLAGVQKFDEFQPSICVVDIGLPDMDGFEVARHINRSNHRPQLLVALTGYGQETDRKNVMAAGFDLHLVKPVDPAALIDQIMEQLASREHSEAR